MNDIYRVSDSTSGTYRCIVEGDKNCVWMYLHDQQKGSIIGDAPVCCLTQLLTIKEFKSSYRGSGAPRLVLGYTSEQGVIPDLENERIAIDWDRNERSVAVKVDGRPVSKILVGERKGYSIHTIKNGPWGSPWTDVSDFQIE